MTQKVVPLTVGPGIQRDGTQFSAPTYVDGKWVRFQYGRPRKMGGYEASFINAPGPSRGMTMSASNGINYIISGFNNSLQQWTTGIDQATGSGPQPIYIYGGIATFQVKSQGAAYTNGVYNNVPVVSATGNNALATVVVASNAVNSVTITNAGTNYLTGNTFTFNATDIGGTGGGFGAVILTVNTFIPNDNNLWQMDIGYDPYGTGNNNLIAHPGQNLNDITSTINTRPLVGSYTGITVGPVGVFTASGTLTNGSASVTFASTNLGMGAGVTVTGTGIPSNTKIVSASTVGGVWTVVLSNNATVSGLQTLTFDNNISISGGVVMLYPYLFVYGNNGLIQNCAAGNFDNWTTADANQNNVASTKVVKGLPLRGGTTSPAGLFWTLDSVVRVTYAPQTVGNSTLFWRYDLITQQSSIMSSSCVIEYDGLYYWVGTDRFLVYNGVVQEVENKQNFNYFFDNLNIAQRQKVWASKVPRWGEIWWFFPSGTSEECNDAIIYNVREKCWYDAGQALGARRSAGVFSEVFRRPIWGGWEQNNVDQYSLWQHEIGTDEVYTNKVLAIESYFETNVLGANLGLVGTAQGGGDNLWTRCERVEPDFVQSGEMYLIVTGKGYADDVDQPSDPYTFDPTTLKIDMKEQRREMRMRFGSNTYKGNYFLGKTMLSIETGDQRGTGNP